MQRFLINLRHADSPESSSSGNRFSQFSAPNFHIETLESRAIGDLGQPLEFGEVDDEMDDEELSEAQNNFELRPRGGSWETRAEELEAEGEPAAGICGSHSPVPTVRDSEVSPF